MTIWITWPDWLRGTRKRCHRTALFSGEGLIRPPQFEPIPNVHQGFSKAIDQLVIMIRRRRDPQPFQPSRHGRVIDRLDVDAVIRQQEIGRHLALPAVTAMARND